MKVIIVLLGMFAAFAGVAKADGFVTVSATGTFLGQNLPGGINFSMVSLFDTTTMQIGTTVFAEADTYGLGAFTFMPFSGGSPVWDFVDSHGDMIQVDPNQITWPGLFPTFPATGSYASDDVILICQNGCNGAMSENFQNGGSLTVSAVATLEPNSFLLLLIGLAVLAMYKVLRPKDRSTQKC